MEIRLSVFNVASMLITCTHSIRRVRFYIKTTTYQVTTGDSYLYSNLNKHGLILSHHRKFNRGNACILKCVGYLI